MTDMVTSRASKQFDRCSLVGQEVLGRNLLADYVKLRFYHCSLDLVLVHLQ